MSARRKNVELIEAEGRILRMRSGSVGVDEDERLDIFREHWGMDRREGRRARPAPLARAPRDPDEEETQPLPRVHDCCGQPIKMNEWATGHRCPPSPHPPK